MSHEVAQVLWEELKQRFGQANALKIANLQDEIHACKQGSMTVTQYYTLIKGLWEEYSQFSPIVPCNCAPGTTNTCPAVKAFQTKQDTDYLIRFLRGLNAEYDVVKTQLLMMKPLPSITSAYDDALQHEEKLKGGITIGQDSTQPVVFAAATAQAVSTDTVDKKLFCRYCKKDTHVIEDCRKLKWKREQEQKRKGGNLPFSNNRFAAAITQDGQENKLVGSDASAADSIGLTAVELHQLKSLLQSSVSPVHRAFSVNQGSPAPPTHSGTYILSSYKHKDLDAVWILDTGASDHICCTFECLLNPKPVVGVYVYLPNSSRVLVSHIGSVKLPIGLTLHNVLFVPSFGFNLVSISKLTHDLRVSLLFKSRVCHIQDLTNSKMIGLATETRGLYQLNAQSHTSKFTSPIIATTYNFQPQQINLWHWRLGHASLDRVKLLQSCNPTIESENILHCQVCHLAKQKRLSFPVSDSTAAHSFDLIHVDIWGPLATESYDKFSYFLTIVDDYSRGVWVYLMKHKSESRNYLESFCLMVKNQFGRTVKVIRSDQGKEFLMTKFFSDHGILHQMSCVETPQQNARVERKHQHILNVARALQFQAGLPLPFWSDCVLHAVYLINRMPTPILNKHSPYEKLHGSSAILDNLKVFGCLCYASTLSQHRTKFQPRARQCVFLGMPSGIKGYKVMDLHTNQTFVSRDVIFYESIFPFKDVSSSALPQSQSIPPMIYQESDHRLPPAELSQSVDHSSPPLSCPAVPNSSCFPQDVLTDDAVELEADTHIEAPDDGVSDDPPPRRSTRARNIPVHLKDYHLDCSITRHSLASVVSYAHLSDSYRDYALAVVVTQEPNSYSEAVKDLCWRTAMEEELSALDANQTWDIVPLPSGKKPVGCRWVYKIKLRSDGTIERHKARLVAKGFTQVYGIDFLDTFSPVAKINSVKSLLAVASAKQWHLQQMDVSNAFLHGELEEEVYMQIPPGLSVQHGMCCRLKKSLYGLKQASRQWFAKLTQSLLDHGFRQSSADYSLFIKGEDDHMVILLVYVDDIILASASQDEIDMVKLYLQSNFKIKDLGDLKFFLGLEVARSKSGIVVNQRKYCIELLNEAGFLECKSTKSPMDPNTRLSAEQGDKLENPGLYRQLVGKLHYLTITRPDIAFAVQQLSQYQSEPCVGHLQAAQRILRYLKSSPGQGLFYKSDNELVLQGFCDSDWATCPDTRRSITGYCTYLGSSLVTWKSKKQTTVSRSSSEAEYRALAHLVCEIQWLTVLLADLGVKVMTPVNIYCDNRSAIHIAENPVFHERTKHIEIDCHVTRERIKSGLIKLHHVSTEEQLADLFTKGFHRRRLQFLLSKLGVIDIHSPTCGRVLNNTASPEIADKGSWEDERQRKRNTELRIEVRNK
ncbi:Retrovirus-related Pol polyprotein from transposon TNT 1-94 [Linum perenne]